MAGPKTVAILMYYAIPQDCFVACGLLAMTFLVRIFLTSSLRARRARQSVRFEQIASLHSQ
jgi:hypothetical protein